MNLKLLKNKVFKYKTNLNEATGALSEAVWLVNVWHNSE